MLRRGVENAALSVPANGLGPAGSITFSDADTRNGAETAEGIVSRKSMMSKMCMAAILCSGDSVFAQTIFKQMDATGRTTFSDRPSAEGVVVPYLSFPGPERDSVPLVRTATQARSDVEQALLRHSPMRSMHAATIDFNEATRRLTQARQSRRDGIEAKPGERADVGGTSAMDRRYQRRQQRLERAVVVAELRSHQTALIRSALAELHAKIDPPRPAQP